MPRHATGRPRGRPVGSGSLGEQARLTVRIPVDLFNRLKAYAEGRAYTRGAPQLARCVREAIEHYLACPHKRQTRTIAQMLVYDNGQTENETSALEDTNRQTENETSALADTHRQTKTRKRAPRRGSTAPQKGKSV